MECYIISKFRYFLSKTSILDTLDVLKFINAYLNKQKICIYANNFTYVKLYFNEYPNEFIQLIDDLLFIYENELKNDENILKYIFLFFILFNPRIDIQFINCYYCIYDEFKKYIILNKNRNSNYLNIYYAIKYTLLNAKRFTK